MSLDFPRIPDHSHRPTKLRTSNSARGNLTPLFHLIFHLIAGGVILCPTRNTIPAQTLPGLTRSALPLIAQGGSVKLAMGRERSVKGGLVSLRIGSVNVSTMKEGKVVDMAARRHWISAVFRRLDDKVSE